jgi:OmpA-OmpF porin, OOP family
MGIIRGMWLALQGLAALAVLATATGQDAAGGQDHPEIARYQGSRLIAWRDQGFAEVRPLGFIGEASARTLKVDRELTLTGAVTERFYLAPRGRTALEVQLNYEEALKNAGATVVYGCDTLSRKACPQRGGPAGNLLLNNMVPKSQQIAGKFPAYQAFGATSANLRLAVLELKKAGVSSWFVVYSVDSPVDSKEYGGSAATYLQVIEPKPVDLGKVAVYDAARITKDLESEGKLALYGIEFESGKADLLPGSQAQLAQMAQALNQNPSLKVYIVGHTDNTGSLAANVALSQQRADAVVSALTRDHRINPARLSGKGVASYSPVASNSSESGRARNRRVEMVVQ